MGGGGFLFILLRADCKPFISFSILVLNLMLRLQSGISCFWMFASTAPADLIHVRLLCSASRLYCIYSKRLDRLTDFF